MLSCANAAKVRAGDIVMLNLLYEISDLCTSIIVRLPNGNLPLFLTYNTQITRTLKHFLAHHATAHTHSRIHNKHTRSCTVKVNYSNSNSRMWAAHARTQKRVCERGNGEHT